MINAEKLNNKYFNQKRKNIFEENKDKKPKIFKTRIKI